MKTVHIDGIVGLDISAEDIRSALKAAGKEEVDFAISSPGGSVYEGLAIFNAIRDHRKSGGKVIARIIGLAASMASYIMLAADRINVEENAILMIHNAWGAVTGDYREMFKKGEILEGITNVMAAEYAKKSGKSEERILEMLDSETTLFGREIVDEGFADSIITQSGTGSAFSKASAMATARTNFEAARHRMGQTPERFEIQKAAALLGFDKDASTPFGSAEKERVAYFNKYLSDYPNDPQILEIVNRAIRDKKKTNDPVVNVELNVAIRDRKGLSKKDIDFANSVLELVRGAEKPSINDHLSLMDRGRNAQTKSESELSDSVLELVRGIQ